MKLPDGDFSELDMEVMKPFLDVVTKSANYLEIGVKHGRSLAFARKYAAGNIYGIDKDYTIDQKYFKNKDVHFIHAFSNEAVKDWKEDIDLLFIDGDHTYEGVKDDWNNFSPFVKKGGVVLFHDCDSTSPGVVQLANEVANKNGWGELRTYKELIGNTSMASLRRNNV